MVSGMFWKRKNGKNKKSNRSRNRKKKTESMFDDKEIKKLLGSVM